MQVSLELKLEYVSTFKSSCFIWFDIFFNLLAWCSALFLSRANPHIFKTKSVKNCHSIHYFLIIQPLAYMLKYNVSKTGLKMDMLNQQNAAQEKWLKGTQVHISKIVRNALAGPKHNHMTKNEMEMGKYSLIYHKHKISRLCMRKMIKGTQLNFKKGYFIKLNCLL